MRCNPSAAHPYRAWYSAAHALRFGAVVYHDARGAEVDVSAVYCPEHGDSTFAWPDRVERGEVVAFVRGSPECEARLEVWQR